MMTGLATSIYPPLRAVLLTSLLAAVAGVATGAERARDLGIPFEGVPGPLNGITDVTGVEVGHTTVVSGAGQLVRGQGPVRTGITVIHPRGKDSTEGVYGGWFTLNASG